jgi:exopolysaccharide biosynthesis polyprenyl glycosylphosphotransferase
MTKDARAGTDAAQQAVDGVPDDLEPALRLVASPVPSTAVGDDAVPVDDVAAPGALRTTSDRSARRRPRGSGRFARLSPLFVGVDLVAVMVGQLLVEELLTPRLLAFSVLILALFAVGGLYRPRLTPSVLDDLPSIIGRALVAGAIVTAVGAYDDGSAGQRTLHLAFAFAALTVLGRTAAYAGVRAARRSGRFSHRTLIVGGGEMSGQLAQMLIDHPEIGLEPVGFLDDDPLLHQDRRPVPHLGKLDVLADAIIDERVGNVVVAFGSVRESEVVDVLRACDRMACEMFYVPRLYELHAVSRDTETVWGIPLLRLRRAPFRTPLWHVKRGMDVVCSLLALVALSPVLGACALMVRLSVGSPVLFRQQRVGLDGRPFTLLKFCSMQPSATTDDAPAWNIAADPQLTRVGKLLRRTSLDELPQLWNILRGDMSLVGPRPERQYFVDQFSQRFPRYMARHRVPSGLTGAAQVAGLRGDTSIADRARFDNYYIENWSLWEDCKLLLRTVSQVVRAAGR